MIDLLGHVFYVSVISGQALITRHHRWGWVLRLIGDAGWTSLGWIMGMTSIWVWGAMFAVIDISGFCEWKRKQKDD